MGSNIEIVIEFWMFIYQACYLFFVILMGEIQLKTDLPRYKIFDLFDLDSVTLLQIICCYAKFMYEALEIFNQEHNLIK